MYSDVVTMIQSIGFPIVMCGAMSWFVKYSYDKNREDMTKLNEQHNAEMEAVTNALNNNTLAIQHLCDKIGGNSYETI